MDEGSGGGTGKEEAWAQLNNLKELHAHGFISQEEFEERKAQLVDQLTGTHTKTTATTATTATSSTYNKGRGKGAYCEIAVVARPPPDFALIPGERARLHTFDASTRRWTKTEAFVKVEGEPFAKGSLRLAFHCLIGATLAELEFAGTKVPMEAPSPATPAIARSLPLPMSGGSRWRDQEEGTEGGEELDGDVSYVLKLSIDPFEDREVPFKDVETQMYSKQWAKQFNRYNPPKRIDFIACSIVELLDRPNTPLCTVEQFIKGPYRKHNNNWGYVSEDERNTPQAFSHFTHYASNGTLLICDIQGVGDLYTDPQIHTLNVLQSKNHAGFGGRGNLGSKGFDKFLRSHRCNGICRYLQLPPVNPKVIDTGTLPSAQLLRPIEFVEFEIGSGGSSGSGSLPSETSPLVAKKPRQGHHPQEESSCCCIIL